jgi:hypothetical protein
MSFKFLKYVAASLFLMAGFSTSTYAAEINQGAFSGNINTTVSSGFSMRVQERDCLMIDGLKYSEAETVDAAVIAGVIAGRGASSNLTQYVSGSGGGCAAARTDEYGNTTNKYLDFYGNQVNNGNLNYNSGDIFSATQKIYSEIDGTINGTTGLRLSFTGSFNPALSIDSPNFQALTSEAESAFESDLTLLDAYITESYEVDNMFVDLQIGRFVTSWGEATFLPIGMNGLVTNALDLSKLRSPGSGVKEALMPTETISVALGLEDGSGIEFYYQHGSDRVGLDASGTYFGSETFGEGARALLANGPNYKERLSPEACPHMLVGTAASALSGYAPGAGQDCTQANAEAFSQHASNWSTYNTTALAISGFEAMGTTEWALARGIASTHNFTSNQDALTAPGFNGLTDDGSRNHLAISAPGATVAVEAAFNDLDSAQYDMGGTVDLQISRAGLYKDPSDSGQYGFRYNKYVDTIGSGVDFGFYFANYHSKVPYIQFNMPGNIFAGDILGAYLLGSADYAGTDLTEAGGPDLTAGSYDLTGTQAIHQALSNAALSSGLCSAVLKSSLRGVVGASGATNYATGNARQSERDNLMVQAFFTDEFANGDRAHDASECYAMTTTLGNASGATAGAAWSAINPTASAATVAQVTANNAAAAKATINAGLIGTGARLFAAVTPINMITYQGIFPEDNKIVSGSFSTNVGSTTVQGELAFRPDFPLATDASDQIAQLNDKNGAHDALNFVAIAGADAAAANAAVGSVGSGDVLAFTATAAQTTLGLSADAYYSLVGNYERSTLGSVWDANGNPTTDLTSRYYSKAYIEYDTWSGSLGTTTSFQASHPVTMGLGADSAAFLTEVGFVAVPDMNNAVNGFVARGGANEGPSAGGSKCLGAVGTSVANLSAASAAISNLGSGVVDALFGNGGFCEKDPGADDMAMTYRLIGTATYNNFMNSPWTLSPNFAWAHDFNGNAPSSLGGFVEDRMTLSLGASLSRGGTSVSGSYINYVDDPAIHTSGDKDYLSLSISHSF